MLRYKPLKDNEDTQEGDLITYEDGHMQLINDRRYACLYLDVNAQTIRDMPGVRDVIRPYNQLRVH